MVADAEPRSLDASIEIDAPRARVWAVVSDVRRTGEWSPECTRVVPLGRLRRGTLLLGTNRRGAVRWATISRITALDEGREIAWNVVTNRSQWTYRLDGDAATTRLTETRRTPRGEGSFALWFTQRLLGGQRSHDDELEAGMAAGLEAIKAIAEQR